MIDYQEIIENLTEQRVKEILDQLEIPYVDKGDYLLMPTYCHNNKNDDASHKLYYYKNSKIFMCYTHCEGQSIFRFLKNYYKAQDIEYDWYRDIYSVIVGNTAPEGFSVPTYKSLRGNYEERQQTKLPTYSKGVLECFVKWYAPEWLSDGISKEAMDKYDIRYSISQNKIIIPHYAATDGALIGIRGRALNEYDIESFGKYMPVQIEGKWYAHQLSLNLYGLYQNKDNIKKTGIVYVAEGEKSVLQAESFSEPNCVVAVCGSQFNKFQLNLLLKLCAPREIIICFDKEEDKNNIYFNKLWKICKKYSEYSQFSFIYDKENLLKMKESPFDNGEKIFKQLVKERIKVK